MCKSRRVTLNAIALRKCCLLSMPNLLAVPPPHRAMAPLLDSFTWSMPCSPQKTKKPFANVNNDGDEYRARDLASHLGIWVVLAAGEFVVAGSKQGADNGENENCEGRDDHAGLKRFGLAIAAKVQKQLPATGGGTPTKTTLALHSRRAS
ncbi:hypothetical protein SCUP234_06077 [Seiridium cupressi]